tara:strand:- start:2348 stop:2740 length:393 start_codon:yes stop_codon:yes gene_type:complete
VAENDRRLRDSEVSDAVHDERWRSSKLFFGGLVAVAMPILLGMSSWAVLGLLDLRERVKVIEATRYTADKAQIDRRERRARLAELEKQRLDEGKDTMRVLRELAIQGARIEAAVATQAKEIREVKESLRK